MSPLPRFSTLIPLATAALAILFLATPAIAQMAIGLTCPKQELVPYEPVRVTVSITNQSALPILLAPAHGHRRVLDPLFRHQRPG